MDWLVYNRHFRGAYPGKYDCLYSVDRDSKLLCIVSDYLSVDISSPHC